MKGKKISILIEGGGTATVISVIKGLRSQNEFKVHIVTCDMDDFVAGKYMADRFYQSIPSSDPNYIDSVLSICEKEAVDIYIPIIDYGFEKLARARERFSEKGIYLMLASPESILTCVDKSKTYAFFKKNNIPTPETALTLAEAKRKKIGYPFLIKPQKGGRASLDVNVIRNKDDFSFHFHENFIIQELLKGQEFTADCLSNLDGSLFIEAVVRERVETKGGLSVKARIANKRLSEKIKKHLAVLSTTLRLPGVYNVQGFIDGERISFTEINPRFAGTHVLTIQAGLNSILHILQMFKGEEGRKIKKKIHINRGVKMVRYWNELFIDGDEVYTWKSLLN